MKNETELKVNPCIRCGGKEITIDVKVDMGEYVITSKAKCNCCHEFVTKFDYPGEDIIKSWNRKNPIDKKPMDELEFNKKLKEYTDELGERIDNEAVKSLMELKPSNTIEELRGFVNRMIGIFGDKIPEDSPKYEEMFRQVSAILSGVSWFQKIIEEKEEEKPWPQEEDVYFELMNDGEIDKEKWSNHIYDKETLKRGNIFRTEKEVKREDDRRVLIQELKEFAGDQSWIDWEEECQRKFCINYNHNRKKFVVSHDYEYQQLGVPCYFQTEERAQKAIDHFGDRLKLLFN